MIWYFDDAKKFYITNASFFYYATLTIRRKVSAVAALKAKASIYVSCYVLSVLHGCYKN